VGLSSTPRPRELRNTESNPCLAGQRAEPYGCAYKPTSTSTMPHASRGGSGPPSPSGRGTTEHRPPLVLASGASTPAWDSMWCRERAGASASRRVRQVTCTMMWWVFTVFALCSSRMGITTKKVRIASWIHQAYCLPAPRFPYTHSKTPLSFISLPARRASCALPCPSPACAMASVR
jgi:hypothetical protein